MARLLPAQRRYLVALSDVFVTPATAKERQLADELAVIGLAEWDSAKEQVRRTALGDQEAQA